MELKIHAGLWRALGPESEIPSRNEFPRSLAAGPMWAAEDPLYSSEAHQRAGPHAHWPNSSAAGYSNAPDASRLFAGRVGAGTLPDSLSPTTARKPDRPRRRRPRPTELH